MKGVGETIDFLMDVLCQFYEFLSVGKFNIFFGEVKLQFKQGCNLKELFA